MKTIQQRLEEEEHDDELIKLRDRCVSMVKMSRSSMSKFYEKWDKNLDVYAGRRQRDKKDAEAFAHDEPEKLVVPMSFAQVQTFVAFCFLLFTQNRRFYEMISTGDEDNEIANDVEEILDRDLRNNGFYQVLYQLLLDVARLNLGVIKHWWVKEEQEYTAIVPETEIPSEFGPPIIVPETEETRSAVKYEGNRISSISPFNFFPDTRFPIRDWQKGSFVADETEWHLSQLEEWEAEGLAYGVEFVQPMDKSAFEKRGETRLAAMRGSFEKNNKPSNSDSRDFLVCLTEVQIKIRPKDFGLGESTKLTKHVVQIANDTRIIRVEPLTYLHDDWTYDLAQFSPDTHQQLGESLSDTIDPLQNVISYLFNSRMASVKRSLENNLVIDPSGVNMASVESRSPWITMKKGAPRLGVDKFLRQLNYQDTTASHLSDADATMKMINIVTGVNENALGQFSGGRRSATEARAANSGSAARPKVTASIIWSSCLAPLGKKLKSNHRSGISLDSFVKILGQDAAVRYDKFHPADLGTLIGDEDHFVFDSTLQSEKGFVAQSLQELASIMMSSPEVMSMLPMDLGALLTEILTLRGVDNIERFKLKPQLPNAPIGPPGIIPEPGNLGPGALPIPA